MLAYFWIALGGALGSMGRFWLTRQPTMAFPWTTLLVNVSGSFVIGFFATLTGPDGRWTVQTGGRHFSWPEFAEVTRRFLLSVCRLCT
jgi:CrcB protein